jgi:hypothetical protein
MGAQDGPNARLLGHTLELNRTVNTVGIGTREGPITPPGGSDQESIQAGGSLAEREPGVAVQMGKHQGDIPNKYRNSIPGFDLNK